MKKILFITKVFIITFLFFPHVVNLYSKVIPDFSDLADELIPSVVSVSVMINRDANTNRPVAPQFPPGSPFEDFFKDFFERRGVPGNPPPRQRRSETAAGSGFIIDEEGLIVTNNHVIANSSSITVILHDGTSLQAKLIGADRKTDLAILKVETDIKLKPVNWGNSDKAKVGNWALAIGNPFGLATTVTLGIVSAKARDINAGPFDDFIQTDAPINRGNSGGPLFNLDGEVIGVNTAIYSPSGGSVGIGFAIPSSLAESVIGQLVEYGKTVRGWLGVRIQTVTPDLAESLGLDRPYGALVATTMPDSPAEKAGIKPGDIILEFNDQEVTEMRKLPRLVADATVNKNSKLVIWRAEKKINKTVLIAELKEDEVAKKAVEKSKKVAQEGDIKELGIKLVNITEDMRMRQNIPEGIYGLLVLNVEQNSEAERKGIRPGDIIQEINQVPVNNVNELKEVVRTSSDKKGVLLLVNRQGNIIFVALKVKN
ncbi:MAG: DegQ family serine endoprotease [Pseudomonadota bacterium]|nr:DegQ family serine endoprotease [Pseudomonadota bacterium]